MRVIVIVETTLVIQSFLLAPLPHAEEQLFRARSRLIVGPQLLHDS